MQVIYSKLNFVLSSPEVFERAGCFGSSAIAPSVVWRWIALQPLSIARSRIPQLTSFLETRESALKAEAAALMNDWDLLEDALH
jgi:hypothetical protein